MKSSLKVGKRGEISGQGLTYHILVPHYVEEGVEWEVVVGSGEARQGSEYGSGDEDSVQVLLETSQFLFHYS